jgi:hypothetical protein
MTTVQQQIDQQKMEAFAERILSDINSSMTTFTIRWRRGTLGPILMA